MTSSRLELRAGEVVHANSIEDYEAALEAAGDRLVVVDVSKKLILFGDPVSLCLSSIMVISLLLFPVLCRLVSSLQTNSSSV